MNTIEIHTYKDRYPTRFVLPRQSRHSIKFKRFIPGRYLHSTYDGAALIQRLAPPDLTHAWNRVPLNSGKFIMSFESHLPRMFSGGAPGEKAFSEWMGERICSNDCRRITALSHYAKRQFLKQHRNDPNLPDMVKKLIVRYPNFEVSDRPDLAPRLPSDPLKVAFVGGHFARKGGLSVLRLAELCAAQNLPVEFTLVSGLCMGRAVWTDPSNSEFYEPYEKLYSLPNVSMVPSLPNAEIRELFARSDLSLLPTFADTFGYSAVESMAEYCPAIVSDSGVFPEFITHGENGYLLPIETNELGTWPGTRQYDQRHTAAFEKQFSEQVDRFAEDALKIVMRILDHPETLTEMRSKARDTVERLFTAKVSAAFWDNAYERYAAEPTEDEPVNGPLDVDSPSLV